MKFSYLLDVSAAGSHVGMCGCQECLVVSYGVQKSSRMAPVVTKSPAISGAVLWHTCKENLYLPNGGQANGRRFCWSDTLLSAGDH